MVANTIKINVVKHSQRSLKNAFKNLLVSESVSYSPGTQWKCVVNFLLHLSKLSATINPIFAFSKAMPL